jgi:hypothetical protein
MKSYNFVKYEFHDSKTFGFYIFSNYKKSNGKRVKYLDINGEPGIIKWIDPVAMLDLDNEGHALMDEFLKGHPAVRSNEWTRVDLKAQERRETTDTLDSARAVIQAAKMTIGSQVKTKTSSVYVEDEVFFGTPKKVKEGEESTLAPGLTE